MYAEFTLSVTNNVPKVQRVWWACLPLHPPAGRPCLLQADLLIAEAERVEESQTKEYQRETTASVRLMAISDFDGEHHSRARAFVRLRLLLHSPPPLLFFAVMAE